MIGSRACCSFQTYLNVCYTSEVDKGMEAVHVGDKSIASVH